VSLMPCTDLYARPRGTDPYYLVTRVRRMKCLPGNLRAGVTSCPAVLGRRWAPRSRVEASRWVDLRHGPRSSTTSRRATSTVRTPASGKHAGSVELTVVDPSARSGAAGALRGDTRRPGTEVVPWLGARCGYRWSARSPSSRSDPWSTKPSRCFARCLPLR
jgi:hypothetical protein